MHATRTAETIAFEVAFSRELSRLHYDAFCIRAEIVDYAVRLGTVDGCELVEDGPDRRALNLLISEWAEILETVPNRPERRPGISPSSSPNDPAAWQLWRLQGVWN